MAHQVGSGWLDPPLQLRRAVADRAAAETGNRADRHQPAGRPGGRPVQRRPTATTQHGNMTPMPHLASLTWDEDDRLRSTARQATAGGTPQTTFYAYDGGGQRVRKVTDRPAARPPAGRTAASRKSERIYLGSIEIYREYAADGTTVTLERETLHVADGRHGHRADRDAHRGHRQGAGPAGPLPARQPPGLGGARARRPGEHHQLRGVLPVRQHVLPGGGVPDRRCRSGTATPARNATRRTTSTTTAPATTRPGWGGGPAATRPAWPTGRICTSTRAAIRSTRPTRAARRPSRRPSATRRPSWTGTSRTAPRTR